MSSRGKQPPLGAPPPGWLIEDSVRINNRIVERDSVLRIKGRRGDHRFIRQVTTPTAVWIDVFDPLGRWVSVRTDAVTRVRNARSGVRR